MIQTSSTYTPLHDTMPPSVPIAVDTAVPSMLQAPIDTTASDEDTVVMLQQRLDSLFYPSDSVEPTYRQSLFTELPTSPASTAQPRPAQSSNTWIFATIILLFIIISAYINTKKFKVGQIFSSLFNKRAYERLSRENDLRPIALIPLTYIYMAAICLAAIAMMRLNGAIHLTLVEPVFYLLMLAGAVVFITLKNSIIRMIGNVFEDKASTHMYLQSNYLFYFVGGILLPPILLAAYFSPTIGDVMLKASIITITILFVLRLIRSMGLILINSKSSKLYLFYYLCILEITPILVMAKILTQ